MMTDLLPVTLLCGFLGAGKTTLLNRILTQNHGKRIAVVENEFGEISIDHELVIGADDDLFEMSNGCVCCSIRTDLIDTLNRLLKRHDRFDAIVIEATGLASPAPIAQAFLVEDELQTELKLDGVVTLVDAVHVEKQLEELDVAWEQIAFSNLLLLNKIDLVSSEEQAKLKAHLKTINPVAPIISTQNAEVDLDQVLGIGGFDLDPSLVDELEDGHASHGHGEEDIGSVSLTVPGEIDEFRFQTWLNMLLITEGMDVFRAKGILNVADTPDRVIFQSVFMRFDTEPGKSWGDASRINRMVFIGRGLDADRLKAGVQSCMV